MNNIREKCPKCERGSLTDGPYYAYALYDASECLTWKCSQCGYSESEPTKDHKEPEIDVSYTPKPIGALPQ